MGSMMPGNPKNDTGVVFSSPVDMLPDTASATLKVWHESPDKGRVEVVSASLPDVGEREDGVRWHEGLRLQPQAQ